MELYTMKMNKMKTTNRFYRKAVYSDVDSSRNDVTIFKYLGRNKYLVYFRLIGGNTGYYIQNEHAKYGLCIAFPSTNTKKKLSSAEIKELINRGIITEDKL